MNNVIPLQKSKFINPFMRKTFFPLGFDVPLPIIEEEIEKIRLVCVLVYDLPSHHEYADSLWISELAYPTSNLTGDSVKRFQVTHSPTWIWFVDGKEVLRKEGAYPEECIRSGSQILFENMDHLDAIYGDEYED